MKINHIFFDLDHTLWDFERCSEEALNELYESYQMKQWGLFTPAEFQQMFTKINSYLWERYNHGLIKREQLRKARFVRILTELGLPEAEVPVDLGEEYIALCPQKPYLMPYAKEILDYLSGQGYQLHIITNGFEDVQHIKMKSSGIDGYFNQVVTSDKAGQKKPYRKIFDYALEVSNAQRSESIMVGDNLETDIKGAKLAEMAHIFYNPFQQPHQEDVQIEVKHLQEIEQHL
ncbi:YjjG family noncanonical pyrimidine nucleotidase [Cytophagales bacterium LB-30]|uniref:YjjG family noncanonical pyrimidine nucleotidase n=1 Tax=Shiella aurantiaca TaxID=3058365 RepID=A0ABT8F8S6_9BACT|nr:YjjG family noncanonical pyrimidine nucleotidase [Shiella aurantiaca]MDN4166882.1 YjjG family noncanonical pyrimidine nucleotidase [Shiella aurantiaca]